MLSRLSVLLIAMLLSTPAVAQIYRGETTTDTSQDTTESTDEATDGDTESEPVTEEAEAPEEEPVAPYSPLLSFDFSGMRFEVPLQFSESFLLVSDFPLDNERNYDQQTALDGEIRVGAVFDTLAGLEIVHIRAEYEHAILQGIQALGLTGSEGAPDLPLREGTETYLRKASLQLDFEDIHVLGGFTTSSWGLGLVSNDGARAWEPGSAAFVDPRGGDRVLRALGIVGPVTDAALVFGVGGDRVEGDDVLREGDEAHQLVGFIAAAPGQPNSLGAYTVMRRQTSEGGNFTDIQAVDLAGSFEVVTDMVTLTFEAESVFIWGETSLGPSTDFPVHTVRQLGAAFRFSSDFGQAGAVLDILFASGDNNMDDEFQSAFKADRNYEMGLLLFRYLNAGQSAQSSVNAFDPELSGYPAEDLDRISTRGSASNTWSFFPRAWWRPVRGLEIYGGPMFALTAVDPLDPFNTRIAGGDPRNTLNGDPGGYYGTELDLGVRYRRMIAGTELTVGLEGGYLLAGGAFNDANGEAIGNLYGGRGMVSYRF